MNLLRGGASRLVAYLSLGAGLVLGAGIGLPTAHWVSEVLIRAPVLAPTSPGPASAGGSPRSSGTAAPISAAPSPSSTPSASLLACPALASGQQPLGPLHPAPSGFAADAALDWVGCGAQTLPAMGAFTVAGTWLLAVAYTCPGGTAAAASGPTVTVSDLQATASAAAPAAIASHRGDSASAVDGGPGGAALAPGSYRLSVAAPPACLWHLAIYRG
jgi:hypothetical protein